MIMKKLILFCSIVFAGLFQSCEEDVTSGIVCTQEFRSIGVSIIGGSLTDYYTVRNSNLDTIRFSEDINSIDANWYPILDDSYQSKIANSEEVFTFIGEINNTIVINEEYIIKADECHIEKISGKSEIHLPN